ncbi:MAG TPA: peptide chain release factor N(5)-glutamine methyltransferase [Candidatus Fimivivens sp.]|nr:peptide chain release factor N(5)-glutamine methyltransferase [Candidatus Fimivivens sp.]
MTLRDLRQEYHGSVTPGDFDLLAAFSFGTTKEAIMREPDRVIDNESSSDLRHLLDRRAAREPVAYIVGEREFYGLPFSVTRDTLVPRPETEHLVEEAIGLLSETAPDSVVIDLGSGSGAIAVSVAHATSKKETGDGRVRFFATDLSSAALEIAKRNTDRHGVDRLITFFEGNLLDPIPEGAFIDALRVVILANLPYLSRDIYESADDDVRLYEPESALVADDDGLALYIELLDDLVRKRNSAWSDKQVDGLFEIGPEQSERIAGEFASRFPDGTSDIVPDLSGRQRVFRFRIG